MSDLAPWAYGPFELLLHAELHLRNGNDFDRRMAMISFDNAIEVAITAYLSLNPLHRQGRSYAKLDVEVWTQNYHTKLDFFEAECGRRSIAMQVSKTYIVWYHDIRNEQYHTGKSTLPDERALKGIREAALWIFSILYDVPDVEKVLGDHVAALSSPSSIPSRDDALDRLLDNRFGLVEMAGELYYTSDLLYSYDPVAYSALGLELRNSGSDDDGDK